MFLHLTLPLFSKEASGSRVTVLALVGWGGSQRFPTRRGVSRVQEQQWLFPDTSAWIPPLHIAAGLWVLASLSSAEFVNKLPTSTDVTLAETPSRPLDRHAF